MRIRNGRTLHLIDEVEDALQTQQPVVAFETTILTFGLPRPMNAEVAAACELIARSENVVPATLAVLDGEIRVGLTPDEIEYFCSGDSEIRKVNLQNLSAMLHRSAPGALTVAACLQVCSMAGIRIFATGGIGGVHRQYHQQLDVSADLLALSRFPVCTVCAGAKSILDVPATLEALETLGIPVVGYQTDTFPLFHARESEHRLDVSFDDVDELTEFLKLHFNIARGGVLVVTPVPPEHAIPADQLNGWINSALQQAQDAAVRGKQVTPYLLARLEELSNGHTLLANRALIQNNSRLAASLAKAMA